MRHAVLKQNKSWCPITLLVGQVVAQTSAVLSLFLFDWELSTVVTAMWVYCSIMLGITMGYHRLYSHKAWNCPKPLEYYLLFFAHIMMVGSNNLGGKPQRTSQICRHTKRPALATLQGSDACLLWSGFD